MAEANPFADLLRRIRAGDAQAAEELVRHYAPVVRVAVQARLTDPSIHRLMDSLDICQSVLASFFVRAAAGQYDLDEPGQLVGLLTRMARNKLASHVRQAHRLRRDSRRVVAETSLVATATPEPGPDRIAAGREMLAELRRRLGPEERDLADRRGAGQTWDEIAEALGGTAQARRKQLSRAIDRVAPDLGCDDDA